MNTCAKGQLSKLLVLIVILSMSGSALGAATPSCEFQMRTRVIADGANHDNEVRFGGLVIQVEGDQVAAIVPRFIIDLEHPSGFYQANVRMLSLVVIEGKSQSAAKLTWLPRWDDAQDWAVVSFKSSHIERYEVMRPATAKTEEKDVKLRLGEATLFADAALTAKRRSVTREDYEFKDPEVNVFTNDGAGKLYVPFGTAILNSEGAVLGMWQPSAFIEAFTSLRTALLTWGDVRLAAEGMDATAQAQAKMKGLVGLGTLIAGLYTGGIATILSGVGSIASADAELRTPAGAMRKTAEANIEKAKVEFKDALQIMLLGFVPWTKLPAIPLDRWWEDQTHSTIQLPEDTWKINFTKSKVGNVEFQSADNAIRGSFRFLSGAWTLDEAAAAARNHLQNMGTDKQEISLTDESVKAPIPNTAPITDWRAWKVMVASGDTITERGFAVARILNNSVWLFYVRGSDATDLKAHAVKIAGSLTVHAFHVRAWFISGDFKDLSRVDKGESLGPEIHLQMKLNGILLFRAGPSTDQNDKTPVFPKRGDTAEPVWNYFVEFDYTTGDSLELSVLEEDFSRYIKLGGFVNANDETKKGNAGFLLGWISNSTTLKGQYVQQEFTYSLDVRHNYHHSQLQE